MWIIYIHRIVHARKYQSPIAFLKHPRMSLSSVRASSSGAWEKSAPIRATSAPLLRQQSWRKVGASRSSGHSWKMGNEYRDNGLQSLPLCYRNLEGCLYTADVQGSEIHGQDANCSKRTRCRRLIKAPSTPPCFPVSSHSSSTSLLCLNPRSSGCIIRLECR